MAALTAGMDIPGRDNKLIYTESVYTAWGEKDGATAADWVNSNLKGIEKTTKSSPPSAARLSTSIHRPQ